MVQPTVARAFMADPMAADTGFLPRFLICEPPSAIGTRNPLRESPKARAALNILERHGWLVPLDPGTVVRGAARKEAWAIVKGAGDVV